MEAIKINDFQLSTFSLLLVVQQQVRGGPAFTICGLAFHCISSLYFADQGPLGQVGLGFWKAKRFFPCRWRGKPLEMKKMAEYILPGHVFLNFWITMKLFRTVIVLFLGFNTGSLDGLEFDHKMPPNLLLDLEPKKKV